jgi:Flp pilus assembly protein TadB
LKVKTRKKKVTTIDKLAKLPALIIPSLPLLLFLAGIVAFIVAGYLFSTILGTVVLGIGLMVLGWVVSPSQPQQKGVNR